MVMLPIDNNYYMTTVDYFNTVPISDRYHVPVLSFSFNDTGCACAHFINYHNSHLGFSVRCALHIESNLACLGIDY
jgi:hypothetical protein